jgi:hypothetical protein
LLRALSSVAWFHVVRVIYLRLQSLTHGRQSVEVPMAAMVRVQAVRGYRELVAELGAIRFVCCAQRRSRIRRSISPRP